MEKIYIQRTINVNRNSTVDIISNRRIVVNRNQKVNSSTLKHLRNSLEILCAAESFHVKVYSGFNMKDFTVLLMAVENTF